MLTSEEEMAVIKKLWDFKKNANKIIGRLSY